MEDWAEIRRLHRAEGMPVKEIVRTLGVARNTVRSALASEGPPRYVREARGSLVDAVEPRVRELLHAFPRMPTTDHDISADPSAHADEGEPDRI